MTDEPQGPAFSLEDAPSVYTEMRTIARQLLRGERASHSFASSDLAHEVLGRFFTSKVRDMTWPDARSFLRFFALKGKHTLIDHARARLADKRGGGMSRTPFDDPLLAVKQDPQGLVDRFAILDEVAASRLPEAELTAEILHLRMVCSLSEQETAEVLELDRNKIGRLWRRGRAWLQSRLDAERES